MKLKQYYYDKYKEFYLFEEFIKNNGLEDNFFLFEEMNSQDFDDMCDDRTLPLYDYFYSAIAFYYETQNKEVYALGNFENIIDRKFIAFLVSAQGKEFILYDKLKSQTQEISVLDEARLSEDNIDNLPYKPNILNIENFSFCDVIELPYIKEAKILSYIRKFIMYNGNGSAFLDLKDDALIFKMYSDIRLGAFRSQDARDFIANDTHTEDVLDYIAINYE
jgi:hypothetical protein